MNTPTLTLRGVFRTWWPLAGSWILMGLELPAVGAVMARLALPEVSLAAYGGVVFPLSLIIEASIIMLLAASTALSRDWASYTLLRRYMVWMGAGLTLLHALVAFTPLFDLVVREIMGAPEEILEPARIGLMIMTPWTWSIAYRRFQHGVLIRAGRSHVVGIGTMVRLTTLTLVLTLGALVGDVAGIVVGTAAVATAVIVESVFTGLMVRPVLESHVRPAPAVNPPLTSRRFLLFYYPLALTSLITLSNQPIVSAAISRMPDAVASLAVLPVLNGVTFLLRSLGFAYNEVVVSHLETPGALRALTRFAALLATGASSILLLMAATPLGHFWFAEVSALTAPLVDIGTTALWFVIAMPALSVLQHFFQGILVHSRRTLPVTQAVVIYLGVCMMVLAAGIHWGRAPGLYVGLTGVVTGSVVQILWLGFRSAKERRELG